MRRVVEFDRTSLVDGWEPVAFRVPTIGEHFYSDDGFLLKCDDGDCASGPRMVMRKTSVDVNAFDVSTTVLVSNAVDGPFVNRVLAAVVNDRDYPFICESISHHAPNECWRFAKKTLPKGSDLDG